MESTSEPMKIQISQATQGLLDDDKRQHQRRNSITIHSRRPKFITKLRKKVTFLSDEKMENTFFHLESKISPIEEAMVFISF